MERSLGTRLSVSTKEGENWQGHAQKPGDSFPTVHIKGQKVPYSHGSNTFLC